MKTKLQNLFMAALTLAASTQKLGVNLIRVAILVIFVWIGGLKLRKECNLLEMSIG